MSETDARKEDAPVIVIVERRKRQVELSSAEIMKILRMRAARGGRRKPDGSLG